MKGFDKAVYSLVRKIPKGFVSSYGAIAAALAAPRSARAVGFALMRCKHSADIVPWHRVLNAKGRISSGGRPERPALQKELLESEGLQFDKDGKIDFEIYFWRPDDGDL